MSVSIIIHQSWTRVIASAFSLTEPCMPWAFPPTRQNRQPWPKAWLSNPGNTSETPTYQVPRHEKDHLSRPGPEWERMRFSHRFSHLPAFHNFVLIGFDRYLWMHTMTKVEILWVYRCSVSQTNPQHWKVTRWHATTLGCEDGEGPTNHCLSACLSQ